MVQATDEAPTYKLVSLCQESEKAATGTQPSFVDGFQWQTQGYPESFSENDLADFAKRINQLETWDSRETVTLASVR